jgi:hypothetical protein
MDDLQMIQAALTHEPPADVVAEGRERLRNAHREQDPSRRRAWLRRPVLVAGGLTVAAAAAAVVVGIGPGQNGHAPPQQSSIRLTGEVLDKAARSTETQPATPEPKPKQWLHWTVFEFDQHGESGGKPAELWERFDGSQSAALEKGKLVVDPKEAVRPGDDGSPMGAYRILAALPTDPQAMLTTLYRKVGSDPRGEGVSGDSRAFENIKQLLANSPVSPPPRVQATMYRALARIPGVTVRTSVEYAPGRTAIGIYAPPSPNRTPNAILLDPATYRMIGGLGSGGAATRSAAVLVARPGQR